MHTSRFKINRLFIGLKCMSHEDCKIFNEHFQKLISNILSREHFYCAWDLVSLFLTIDNENIAILFEYILVHPVEAKQYLPNSSTHKTYFHYIHLS